MKQYPKQILDQSMFQNMSLEQQELLLKRIKKQKRKNKEQNESFWDTISGYIPSWDTTSGALRGLYSMATKPDYYSIRR